MADTKNPFLESSGDFIRPNAVFSPQNYERLGLYVLLYNEILGSLQDYQGSRLDLDVLVNKRIEDVIKIAGKIYKNRADGLPDDNGLDPDDPNFGFAKNWMENIFPISKDVAKANEGAEYCSEFLKYYEPVKAEERRIASLMGKDVLSIKDGYMLLDAKRSKVREFYEMVRGNGDYKPGKIDKKDGSSKNGIHAAAYFAALNEYKKKKRKLHRNAGFNFLKGAAAFGLAAVTVVSAGALLSYGGFALTAMFGTVYSPFGVGAATTGLLGTIFGFYGSKNMFKRFMAGMKKSKKSREEIREFVGKKYRGRDLEEFLGVNWSKDGKGMTLNEKKTLFMFDRAARAFFEKKGGKNDPEFPPELKKYLPDSVIKKWKLEGDKKHFDSVSSKDGLFARLLNKYSQVVDSLALTDDKGQPTKRENLGEARDMVNAAGTLSDVFAANKYLDEYSGNIAPEKVADLRRKLADKTVQTLKNNLFENAYTSTTVGNAQTDLSEERVSQIMAHSATTGEKNRIANAISFLGAEEARTDAPVSKTLGVKIGSQYDMRASSMANACTTLDSSMTPADAATVATVTAGIEGLAKKSDGVAGSALKTAIAGISSPAVRDYLNHMLDKKASGTLNDIVAVQNGIDVSGTSAATDLVDISTTIANLKKVSDNKQGDKFVSGAYSLDEIRQWIMKPSDPTATPPYVGLSADEQKLAMDMLEEQIDSIRYGENSKSREAAFKAIQSGSVSLLKDGKPVQLDEVVTYISGINYEKVKDDEVNMFYTTTVLQATPSGLSDYLKNMFKNRVQETFISYIRKHSSELESGDSALSNVGKFLADVQNCKFLDEGQKQSIIKQIEPKLENAFGSTLKDMERRLLADYGKNEYSPKLIKFIEQPYVSEGFIDYFAQNTVTSNKVLDRIYRLQRGLELTSLLTAGGKEEVPTIVDANSSDTESFLKIYFAEGETRGTTDKLVTKLKELQNISVTANYDALTTTGVRKTGTPPILDANSFVAKMQDYVQNQIIGDASLSEKDKLAAMLVAKKRTLAMFKSHMMKYIKGHTGDPASYILGAGSGALNDIKNDWRNLMRYIDTETLGLQAKPANASYKRTYIYAENSMDDGTSADKFMNFAKSAQLQM